MGINRGKQFEDRLREQFKKLSDTICLRLYDITMGYKNIDNPCDLIVYRHPNIILLECKTTNQTTLNFKSQIRPNQLNSLLQNKDIRGVISGIICWFIHNNKTIFIPIQYIDELIKESKKSFNINNYDRTKVIELAGLKKRIFFDYNLQDFLDNLFTFYNF